jgi:hypothetical protein
MIILLMGACAAQGVLTGGEKDEIPPKVIIEESTPDKSLNFKGRTFYLEFDEYVKVDDIFNQVIVSPPLVYNPKIELRGKKLIFEFNEKEVLRDSTTYTIQFGNAVKDITENNPAKDLRFVFSTGDMIDSIEVSGKITSLDKNEPVADAWALLYDDPGDSIVYLSRPYYFGKTDKAGAFTIRNVKAGTYQMVALKDANNNYKFDNPTEQIGFLDTLITIDKNIKGISLGVFEEEKKRLIQDVDSTQKGRVNIKFSEPLIQPVFGVSDNNVRMNRVWNGASITIFHQADSLLSWKLYVEQANGQKDSINIRSYPLDTSMVQAPLTVGSRGISNQTQHPDSVFYLMSSLPLTSIKPEGFTLYKDSVELPITAPVLSEVPGTLLVFQPMATGNYTLEIDSASLSDIYGGINDSLIKISFTILDRAAFGNLKLEVAGFNPDYNYILTLMKKDLILAEWLHSGNETMIRSFQSLLPDSYELRVIEDINRNGRLDKGNFLQKRTPERQRVLKMDPLRANWDVEQKMSISDWYKKPVILPADDKESDEEKKEDKDDGQNDK